MTDQLPPHDPQAEACLLGVLLLLAADGFTFQSAAIRAVDERFGDQQPFYDLRHQCVFDAIRILNAAGTVAEPVALADNLRAAGKLEAAGGITFLAGLPDQVAAVTELQHWLDLVHQKFLARQALSFGALIQRRAQTTGGLTESSLSEYRSALDHLEATAATALQRAPKNLLPVKAFDERVYTHFFDRHDDTYGYPLPFPFVLRLRPAEMTWFMGEQGSGKSSMLGCIALKVAQHLPPGKKIIIASFEVPCEVTLWIMARQLMGLPGRLEKNKASIAKVVRALAWLNERFLLYDFLGIGDHREVLATFEFARAHQGGELFIVDSFMRIGIDDDDYAMQGRVSERFASFAVKTGSHVIIVDHENKGHGDGKKKIRGSGQKADNAHNIVRMQRNEDKSAAIAEIEAEVRAGSKSQEELAEFIKKKRNVWDSKFVLLKQRWPGSAQNASHWLYFDRPTLQFRNYPDDPPLDFFGEPEAVTVAQTPKPAAAQSSEHDEAL
jgi:KaiC/GvpD/RAD55 family RecA-like ATPase